VLALTGYSRQWHWGAYGKHPVAADYFRLGKKLAIMNLFADWIDRSVSCGALHEDILRGRCSWRFWARGSGKKDLVCGVITNSSDVLGRPYPLLIMGTGPVSAWDGQWDLLPLVFEKVWSQMEYFSTRRFSDVRELEEVVTHIRPPHPEWDDLLAQRQTIITIGKDSVAEDSMPNFRELKERAEGFSAQEESFINIDQGTSHDEFTLILLWHYLLKSFGKKIPNAIFAGGTGENTCLACFARPLNAADFIRLWSVPAAGSEGNHTDS
jgi:type VI secretion system protein VasJ